MSLIENSAVEIVMILFEFMYFAEMLIVQTKKVEVDKLHLVVAMIFFSSI